jgi:uncharacterized protein with beta-barrel porin domain
MAQSYGDVDLTALLAFARGASVFNVSKMPISYDALVVEAGPDWQMTQGYYLCILYSG